MPQPIIPVEPEQKVQEPDRVQQDRTQQAPRDRSRRGRGKGGKQP